MTNILITNDDSVIAPGLLALANKMKSIGDVTILAPDHNWSASGHVKTLHRPIRVKEVILEDGTKAFCSDGAPSDCVALAMLGLWNKKFDLVVSGINSNANLGYDVTYSGTVTAAMEAVIWGVYGISVSIEASDDNLSSLNYEYAAEIAKKISEKVLQNGLPKGTLLNVNIPNIKRENYKGIKVSQQGLRVYNDKLVRRIDPRGQPYYWIGGKAPTGVPKKGTDIGDLAEGFISVTPLKLDMTSYELLEEIKQWDWE